MNTKFIRGIFLPEGDDHFQGHLEQGEEFDGAGTYQFRKIVAALAQTPDDRRGLAVDVGAHVGLWSRVLAQSFDQVIAFEPVPALIHCFHLNVKHLQNVTLHEQAVSDVTGGDLAIEWVPGNTGNSRVLRQDEVMTAEETVRPAVTRLDDVLDLQGGVVDFIKIDVEGWELQVVRGAENIIKRNRPFMVVEQKPGNAERYGITRTAAVDLLKSWGAKVLWEKAGDFCVGWVKR